MPKASVSDDTLDLTSLAYAVLVSENGSFRLAGQMLGVRTSAVSRRVRSLEDTCRLLISGRSFSFDPRLDSILGWIRIAVTRPQRALELARSNRF